MTFQIPLVDRTISLDDIYLHLGVQIIYYAAPHNAAGAARGHCVVIDESDALHHFRWRRREVAVQHEPCM